MDNHKRANLELRELVLASGSPRRSEILQSVGWKFRKIVPEIDESELPGERPEDYVLRLAEAKASAVSADHTASIVLGADTTVVIDGGILGKPSDIDDARKMIGMLAGRWHDVLTGVALANFGRIVSGIQTTRVKFSPMTQSEIDFLAEEGDPLDKAGGYAVQAQAALFIEGIEGDYWNVVGLPISLVYRLTKELTGK